MPLKRNPKNQSHRVLKRAAVRLLFRRAVYLELKNNRVSPNYLNKMTLTRLRQIWGRVKFNFEYRIRRKQFWK